MAVQQERDRTLFYALEQKSRQALPGTPPSEKIVSYLYEWTADFGESFLRPLVLLLLVTEFFMFIYACTMTTFFPHGMPGYDVASLHYAIEQVVRPFSGWVSSSGTTMNALFGKEKGLPFSFKLLSTVQSLANVIFFGLFIFAVRRKFKLG